MASSTDLDASVKEFNEQLTAFSIFKQSAESLIKTLNDKISHTDKNELKKYMRVFVITTLIF